MISLLADAEAAELTWLEDDGEDDDAGDEEGKDAMTEAKDEADVEDASDCLLLLRLRCDEQGA